MKIARLVALTAALSFSLPAVAADFVWATKDLTARRWEDAATPTAGDVKTNDRLEVVYKTEGWYRVKLAKSPKFGWVPADAVTATMPAGAEPPPGPGLENLSPDLQKMIQEKMKELNQGKGDGDSE